MVTRSQKIRLGVFISVSVFAILVMIGVILAPKIFEIRDVYYIGFRDISVTGLQEGGSVKYQGITVGYVSDITIDPKDIRRIIVEVSLDHGVPIREDTEAEIMFLGITGLKLVELKGGSMQAKTLAPGGYIKAGKSIAVAITGRAEVIAEKAEMVLNNIAMMTDMPQRESFLTLIDNTAGTMNELNTILKKNNESLVRIVANIEKISEEMKPMVGSANRTLNRIESLVLSDTLGNIAENISEVTETLKNAELLKLVQEGVMTLERTNSLLKDSEITFSKSRSDLVATIESLREAVDFLNQFSRLVSEDPSVIVRGSRPKDAPDYGLERTK